MGVSRVPREARRELRARGIRIASRTVFKYSSAFARHGASTSVIAESEKAGTPESIVLFVVDDAEQRQSLGRSFCEAGYTARTVENGLDAIRSFCRQEPSLVYLDLRSGVLGGPDTTRILRTLEKDGRRVPILASTPADDGRRDIYFAAGIDRLLTLPLSRDTIRRALVDVAMDAARRSGAGTRSSEHSVATRRAASIDLEGALGRLGGDKSLLADLIQFFFEDAYGLLVAMHKAIDEQKWEDSRRAAHSLKGLASNFGAAKAVAALQAIESCDRTGESAETAETMKRLATVADEEALWLAAALGEYCALHGEQASR
jgi:two-component system sensor histidine kinase/response regulator